MTILFGVPARAQRACIASNEVEDRKMTDRDVRCVRPTSPESPRVALSIFKRIYIVSHEALSVQIAMRDVMRALRKRAVPLGGKRGI